MKDLFFEYHRPTEEELHLLWQSCVFSFDASVLLDLYRFSAESRQELLSTLEKHRERIWITHQAAFEFHKNRLRVIADTHRHADVLLRKMEELGDLIKSEIRQHPYISDELTAPLAEALDVCAAAIRGAKQDPLTDDTISIDLLRILSGRVAQPFGAETLTALRRTIEQRFIDKIPPGYLDQKDKEKPNSDGDSHGDAIVWFQLMELAKAEQVHVVFVSRDRKEDWWTRIGGKTIQPRHELRREFREQTGKDFYLYEWAQFINQSELSDRLRSEAQVLSQTPSEVQASEGLGQWGPSDADWEHLRFDLTPEWKELVRVITQMSKAVNESKSSLASFTTGDDSSPA